MVNFWYHLLNENEGEVVGLLTTFSSLVVDHLKTCFSDDKTAVISIFLQSIKETERHKTTRFSPKILLAEIQRQLHLILGNALQTNSRGHKNPETTLQELHGSEVNADSLRGVVELQIKSFDRVFLVLDDLDLAWEDFEDYQNLEDELNTLHEKGIKILTTSRVQFNCDTLPGQCDANERHRHVIDFWWQCRICAMDDPYCHYVCNECKDAGQRCPKPEHSNLELAQLRQRVHLDIGNSPLKGLLEYHLEEEHGDLGFGSHGVSFVLPPLSYLGHELVNSPQKATALVKYLEKRAKGNITIALLHLQEISHTTSFKEATSVGDRLPKSIIAYFDAEVASITNSSSGIRGELGLASVKSVGQKVEGLEFSDLTNKLFASLKCSDPELRTVLTTTRMEQVMAASRGLLSPEGDSSLVCFHDLFQLYVEQQYSDLLT